MKISMYYDAVGGAAGRRDRVEPTVEVGVQEA